MLPAGLESVLGRAMSRDAAARWPSVRAFGEMLRPFASVGGQALWEAFYTNEVAYVPTLHQWGVPPALETPPLAFHDVAASFAVPSPMAVPTLLVRPGSASGRRGWLIAAGTLFIGLILLCGVVALQSARGPSPAPASAAVLSSALPQLPVPVIVRRPDQAPLATTPAHVVLPPERPVPVPADSSRQGMRESLAPTRPVSHSRSRATDLGTLGY